MDFDARCGPSQAAPSSLVPRSISRSVQLLSQSIVQLNMFLILIHIHPTVLSVFLTNASSTFVLRFAPACVPPIAIIRHAYVVAAAGTQATNV